MRAGRLPFLVAQVSNLCRRRSRLPSSALSVIPTGAKRSRGTSTPSATRPSPVNAPLLSSRPKRRDPFTNKSLRLRRPSCPDRSPFRGSDIPVATNPRPSAHPLPSPFVPFVSLWFPGRCRPPSVTPTGAEACPERSRTGIRSPANAFAPRRPSASVAAAVILRGPKNPAVPRRAGAIGGSAFRTPRPLPPARRTPSRQAHHPRTKRTPTPRKEPPPSPPNT